jgi:hypothetical protein
LEPREVADLLLGFGIRLGPIREVRFGPCRDECEVLAAHPVGEDLVDRDA